MTPLSKSQKNLTEKVIASKFASLFNLRSSILSKLMFVIMLTVTATLLMTGIALTINERFVYRNISRRSVSVLAGVIGSNSTAALAFNDVKVGREILSALKEESEIQLGCLYTKGERLLATYVKTDYDGTCPLSVPALGLDIENGKLSFSRQIISEGETYGTVFIVSDMHTLRARLRLHLWLLLILIMGAAGIAYLIAKNLQRLVTAPILKLADTAKFISEEGQFSLRAEESTEVEINILVNAFNRMLTVIQDREEKILQSEQQFRAAFEVAAVGNVIVSPEGKFIRVNSEFCKMLGYSTEELLRKTFIDITHPEDIQNSKVTYEKLFRNEIDSRSIEKRYVTKAGKDIWTIVSVAPVRNALGRILMFISVIQDISERKRIEEERRRLLSSEREARLEAEKSIQMRDDFISIASHELRTPITPIKLHIDLMKRQIAKLPMDTFPHQGFLLKAFNISERQMQSLEGLIETMLSVSRITSGRLVLNKKLVNLSQLVHSILERFQMGQQNKLPQINFTADSEVTGNWDELKLEQVFLNLLTNAIKYGEGRPIDILVSGTDEKGKLVVKDYGIGISEENLDRIFDKFERVESINRFPGFGLGLFITKEYVKAHHGTIRVESKAGHGSTFVVELPRNLRSPA